MPSPNTSSGSRCAVMAVGDVSDVDRSCARSRVPAYGDWPGGISRQGDAPRDRQLVPGGGTGAGGGGAAGGTGLGTIGPIDGGGSTGGTGKRRRAELEGRPAPCGGSCGGGGSRSGIATGSATGLPGGTSSSRVACTGTVITSALQPALVGLDGGGLRAGQHAVRLWRQCQRRSHRLRLPDAMGASQGSEPRPGSALPGIVEEAEYGCHAAGFGVGDGMVGAIHPASTSQHTPTVCRWTPECPPVACGFGCPRAGQGLPFSVARGLS